MKGFYTLLLLLFATSSVVIASTPEWMQQTPVPENNTYLYVVERGTGTTETEARNRAMGLVYRSTIERLGIYIDMSNINDAIATGNTYDSAEAINVPIRKVCEHIQIQDNKYVIYVLCQVAKKGNIVPDFTPFTDCNKLAKSQYIGHSFVPGMAQIYKGSVGKGATMIAGEVLMIGGIVATECLRQNYAQQIAMTHTSTLKQYYVQNANICNITRNVCIAGAAAFYAWSLIDGIVAKGNKHILIGDMAQLRIAPYADYESGGFAAVVNF